MPIKKEQNKKLQALIVKIQKERGLDLNNYESSFLERRMQAVMLDKSIKTYDDYIELLDKEPIEYDRLFEYLSINKTEFFRDPAAWDFMRQEIFPTLIANIKKSKSRKNVLRIWSAGCASGEEAYSIALLLWDMLKDDIAQWDVQIFATDISEKAILRAQKAIYHHDQLLNVPHEYNVYFTPLDNKQYLLNEKIQSLAWFQKADIFKMVMPVNNDFIFCRNIMIYFSRSLQEKLKKEFSEKICPEGYLILGNAELMLGSIKDSFIERSGEFKIYQKNN